MTDLNYDYVQRARNADINRTLRDAHAQLGGLRSSVVASHLDFYRAVQARSRAGTILPESAHEPAPTSCAYCDAKLATCARKCDNCGAAVKEVRDG